MIRRIFTLALATAIAAPITAPATAAIYAFTGLQSNDTPTPMPSADCLPDQVLVQFDPGNSTSAGTSNFGNFGASQRHCISFPPSSFSDGIFSYDFAAGDSFGGTYSGTLTPSGVPLIFTSVVDFVVTGGTGRFLGAEGFIQGVGTLDRNPQRPVSTLALTGVLNLAAVPEPGSWAMMIAGFGVVGSAMRRKQTTIRMA